MLRAEKLLGDAGRHCSEAASAHTALLSRLLCLSQELTELRWNNSQLSSDEGKRLEKMALTVDQTCAADVSSEDSCRGRHRVDAVRELAEDLQQLRSDLQSFEKAAPAVRKPLRSSIVMSPSPAAGQGVSTASKGLLVSEEEAVASLLLRIEQCLSWLLPALAPLLLTEQSQYLRQSSSSNTTAFITYSFLYRLLHDGDGQSLCSLAVIAGTERVFAFILAQWTGVSETRQAAASSSERGQQGGPSLPELRAMGYRCETLRAAGFGWAFSQPYIAFPASHRHQPRNAELLQAGFSVVRYDNSCHMSFDRSQNDMHTALPSFPPACMLYIKPHALLSSLPTPSILVRVALLISPLSLHTAPALHRPLQADLQRAGFDIDALRACGLDEVPALLRPLTRCLLA